MKMKKFNAFVKKEFLHIMRDKRTLLIVLGMPIIQVLMFGFAINMDVNNIKTVFYTPNESTSTQQIEELFVHNRYFNVKGHINSIYEVEELMKKGKIEMAIVFSPQFDKNLNKKVKSQVQIIVNTCDPNRGTIASNYATAILQKYQSEITVDNFVPYHINVESNFVYNPQMKSVYTFVPGIIGLVITIICAIMTSASIVREKELGSMDVLLSSPINSAVLISAKVAPYIVISIVNVITILLLSVFVLRVPIRGSLLLLLLGSLLFIIMVLTLGILVSSIAKKQSDAVIISGIGLMLPTLVLSGMIFPIDNMPVVLQWFSATVPARWFIAFIKKVMIEGLGFRYVIGELSVMLLMAVAFITASIISIKDHLK